MPTICTVTGQISDIFAGALGELKVEFSSAKTNAYKSGDDVISVKNLRTKTDTNGILTVDLVPGEYTMRLITSSRRVDETQIVVPEAVTASLANLIVSPIPEDIDAAVQAVLNAQSARDEANAARDAASVSETNAATSAANASTSASDSESAKVAAQTARTGAEAAQSGSQSAQISAETARDESQTFASQSQASATNANTAQIAAETAKTASESALTSVNAAKTVAETAQTNAEIAASSANTSESNAFTSASIAASAVDTTTAARDQALVYRDTAENHKNVAEAASASAQSAVAYLNLSGAEETIAVNAVAVWKGVLPYMSLSEQVTKSWYNESASVTRGSRRDLPTSVLVVGEASSVTIYDLDSGAPEMWMVFQTNNGAWNTAANMVHGVEIRDILFVGHKVYVATELGIHIVDFSADLHDGYRDNTIQAHHRYSGNIAQRNDGLGATKIGDAQIANQSVNAIATYTAPNAPLNEAGQPISVVPVGTDGGLSVILEDGSVVKSLDTSPVSQLLIVEQGVWWANSAYNNSRFAAWSDIRNGDGFGDVITSTFAGALIKDLLTRWEQNAANSAGVVHTLGTSANNQAVAGVARYWFDYQDLSKGLSQLQTPDYATPLMFGDCKGSFLQEADDTDLSGAVLNNITDYTTEWTENAGGWTISATELECDGINPIQFAIFTALGGYIAVGDWITIDFDVADYVSGSVGLSYAVGANTSPSYNADGSYSYTGEVTGNNLIYFRSTNFGGRIRNIRLKRASPDRSVNGKGLILGPDPLTAAYINGGKTVGYGPITPTNFPRQPYNPDMDAGTGDYLYRGWAKFAPAQSTMAILARCTSNITGLQILKDTSSATSALRVRHAATNITGSIALDNGQWRCLTVLRRNGVLEAYVEDVLDILAAETSDISDIEPMLEVGYCTANPTIHNLTGKSIFSFSLGAPTAEQVRVAYLAERPRFYGGAVDPTLPETALDMSLDPVTGLLWMIGATKVWAMDGDGILADSTLANKGTVAHNRIDMFDGEPVTWEYAA